MKPAFFAFLLSFSLGAQALVQQQSTGCKATSGTTIPCTLGSTPSSSNVLLLCVGNNNALTTSTVSGASATWTKLQESTTASSDGSAIWIGTTPSSAAALTITMSGSLSGFVGAANVAEFSGTTGTVDLKNSNAAQNGTVTTATLNTTVQPDLSFACLGIGSSSLLSGPINSYTGLTTADNHMQAAYLKTSSTGNTSTGWTYSGSPKWDTQIVALKGSGSVGNSQRVFTLLGAGQ